MIAACADRDMKYKIVFFGTSDFSVPSLRALIQDDRFEIIAVVTKPDMPIGRHQEITAPPVKKTAMEKRIPVLQFESIKTEEAYEELRSIGEADAYVVVSYGKIIPQSVLDLPRKGAVNVHGSLLPRWRGASCVQAAIAAGDPKSGVTIMKMDAELDHGDIIAQAQTEIADNETGGQLHDRLSEIGAKLLPDSLAEFLDGKAGTKPQDHSEATFCRTLKREDGRIDWKKSADEIDRLIRAYEPWPGTYTDFQGKRLKIHRARKSEVESQGGIGALIRSDDLLLAKCGDGKTIELLEVQPEGKRSMSSKEFLAGWRDR